ncbi:NAD(P)H-quinone oxidoreductase subunit J [Prochlorococcus sp. MIT 1223]|uniref:NAD(P)H-quinone oxidoreductase subunit J n=1 Tax=Prochlorococcus sp. MIT 1223 TaxID=3096217 RepID=UPI002A74DD5D|nr:NAD(P)H-quinone oxidoreductase subunit J [Prochlorococcus sp. MIT 1223]
MTEENLDNPGEEISQEITGPKAGEASICLSKRNLIHTVLEPDHLGIEIISVEPHNLYEIISALKAEGFNYLQCQGGYDEGPGEQLVCFYNLISIKDFDAKSKPREVRVKVFLERDGDLSVPSLYGLFRGSDWQERETYDMFGINFIGHPHPKRLLMPEDWKGWPLRKDYVQPDFYEMQDAY